MTTLPKYGPTWKVHLNFVVESLDENVYASVLGIQPYSHPRVEIHNGKFLIGTRINDNANHYNWIGVNDEELKVELDQTYDIILEQKQSTFGFDPKWTFEVTINGDKIISVENSYWTTLNKAEVFSPSTRNSPAKIKWNSLKIQYQIRKEEHRKEGKITKLEFKTGVFHKANLDGNMPKVRICGENDDCCLTNDLDNLDYDDFEHGNVDSFAGSSILGSCNNFLLEGLKSVAFTHSSNNGWYGEYLEIHLDNKMVYFCPIKQWMDYDFTWNLHCTLKN